MLEQFSTGVKMNGRSWWYTSVLNDQRFVAPSVISQHSGCPMSIRQSKQIDTLHAHLNRPRVFSGSHLAKENRNGERTKPSRLGDGTVR